MPNAAIAILALLAAARAPAQPQVAVLVSLGSQDSWDPTTARFARELEQALIVSGMRVLVRSEVFSRFGGSQPLLLAEEETSALDKTLADASQLALNLQYRAAMAKTKEAIGKIEQLADGAARWPRWVDAHILLCSIAAAIGDKITAGRAAKMVLRTRPKLELDKERYGRRVIENWNAARRQLVSGRRTSLTIRAESASVAIDGADFGQTPCRVHLPPGRYMVRLAGNDTTVRRSVELGHKPLAIDVDMILDASMILDKSIVAHRLPPSKYGISLWDGIIKRLGGVGLVEVYRQKGWWVAALRTQSDHVERTGWIAMSKSYSRTARLMARYLHHGRPVKGVFDNPPADTLVYKPAGPIKVIDEGEVEQP
jgi:hypothetical protein